jgi:Lrp/AsnC family leucine-responsive transcriptional regulator
MDDLDSKIITLLSQNARISWAELAQHLGLSAPAAAERVRKLEERGAIRAYAALLNPPALGFGLQAFIAVTLGKPKHRKAFLRAVERMPEILECHHVAGEEDFLLKVCVRDTAHLDTLIAEGLREVSGVLRTKTTVVLSTAKEVPFRGPEPGSSGSHS